MLHARAVGEAEGTGKPGSCSGKGYYRRGGQRDFGLKGVRHARNENDMILDITTTNVDVKSGCREE